MVRKWINSADVEVGDDGRLGVNTGDAGTGAPCTYRWATGTDANADPDGRPAMPDRACGVVTLSCGAKVDGDTKLPVGGAMVEFLDGARSLGSFFVRSGDGDRFPLALPAGVTIQARNLTAGVNFSDLIVQVR
jgi:hypothetical protein